MPSTRLTNDARDRITRKIIQEKTDKHLEKAEANK